jgi:ferrous iron transport protein A
MSLSLSTPGQTLRLVGFTPGFDATQRLSGMGLAIGRRIRVVQQEGGNLVLAMDNTRLALTRALAQKILVIPVQENT